MTFTFANDRMCALNLDSLAPAIQHCELDFAARTTFRFNDILTNNMQNHWANYTSGGLSQDVFSFFCTKRIDPIGMTSNELQLK